MTVVLFAVIQRVSDAFVKNYGIKATGFDLIKGLVKKTVTSFYKVLKKLLV